MSVALLAAGGPCLAALLILLLRRANATLALAGALCSLVASMYTLATIADSTYQATMAWLPTIALIVRSDAQTSLLATTVALVGCMVFVYAIGYMEHESTPRFYAGMSFFLAAMQLLVLAGDWVLLLGAWELIGFASYLLIGYWYEQDTARAAATRAFLVTRTADLGLYLGSIVLITATGTTEIVATTSVGGTVGTVAALLLLLAVIGKSAQVPLQGWLADAMAGPTPVSALLHSATLVAAGVILLLRTFPLLSPGLLLAVALVGGVTAVLTGLTAFAQRDLKRVLAASTSSQLGLMLVAIGAGSPIAAMLHLVAHATIKSSLFLGAGIFQHARESTAFDQLRGIGRHHRVVYASFAVAGLALAGLPPLVGFWSKDAILAATLTAPNAWLLAPMAVAGSLLSAMYISRALRLLWQGDAEAPGTRVNPWMTTALVVMVGLVAALGILATPLLGFLGLHVPEERAAVWLGLLIIVVGMPIGWYVSATRLLGGLRPRAEAGFRLGGGLVGIVARPTLRLAHLVARIDAAIHAVVLGIGQSLLGGTPLIRAMDNGVRRGGEAVGGVGLSLARFVEATDGYVHGGVETVATFGIRAARSARATDEQGIDALIETGVQRLRDLSQRARSLQTGLVHRGLVYTVIGGAGVIVVAVLIGFIRGS